MTRHALIRLLAESGRSDREIGEALDPPCGPDAVRKIRARQGIPAALPPGGSRRPSVWRDSIAALHAEGLTTAEIAARAGYTIRTVQQRLFELRLRAIRPRRIDPASSESR